MKGQELDEEIGKARKLIAKLSMHDKLQGICGHAIIAHWGVYRTDTWTVFSRRTDKTAPVRRPGLSFYSRE